MTVMDAAIEAGWRKATIKGKQERIDVLLDEGQLLYAMQLYFKRSNVRASAQLLERAFQAAPLEARAMFVNRCVPGADARRAAKAAENMIENGSTMPIIIDHV